MSDETQGSQPDYVVVRGTGTSMDGRWLDREEMRELERVNPRPPPTREQEEALGMTVTTLTATGMIEVRDSDGAVAEIFAPKDWVVPNDAP